MWLKEGFSTFYSHYGINHTNPELLPWEMFVPKVLNAAMSFDSTNGSLKGLIFMHNVFSYNTPV